MIHQKPTKETKENIQFWASIGVLVFGMAIIVISLFLPPVGVLHPSVITIFGMLLSFVGAVWNLDLKYEFKTRELERDIERRFRQHRYEEEENNDEVETL